MRIGFDARPLVGARTGVSVWLEDLLRGLAASTDWTLVLFLPRRATVGIEDLAGRIEIATPRLPLKGTLWLTTVAGPAIGAQGVDAYLGTLGILPRRLERPCALMVHDLTPRTLPGRHTLANRYCFNAYFEESVARADEVICLSEATRARLREVLPAHGRRAQVLPAGLDAFFSPPPPGDDGDEVRRRFAGGRCFLVQLGTLEPRKGVDTLLAAHASLLERGTDVDLVLAGGRGWGVAVIERALARHPRPERVHLPGYVAREDARALLRHAEVVVTASAEEGFGLPLAEALACGAACVASDAAALIEVGGGAALHFARGNVTSLADALAAALRPEANAGLREAAAARAPALVAAGDHAPWRELLARLARAPHST